MSAPKENYRYPGIRPFDTPDRTLFYGREQEIKKLSDQIAVEQMVVLFSKSGLGKTSLLRAGVAPELQQDSFFPIFVRLNQDGKSLLDQWKEAYLAHALPGGPPQNAPEAYLWEILKKSPLPSDNKSQVPVFIFDQFEEVFTLREADERREFIDQLAGLVKKEIPKTLEEAAIEQLMAEQISPEALKALEKPPNLRVILAIRSDMLHHLDGISDRLPYILRSRFQLHPLSDSEARKAIERPAADPAPGFQSPTFVYSDDALGNIIDNIGGTQVEPFQLQVVCRQIETELTEMKAEPQFKVEPDFYGGTEGIKTIIKAFYLNQIETLDTPYRLPARLLIEDHLLTDEGRRRSVDLDALLKIPEVDQAMLDQLETRRLLRKEPRLGTFYYEISHDTLVNPILGFRQKRLAEKEEEARRARLEQLEEERKAREEELERERKRAAQEARLRENAEKNEARARKNATRANILTAVALLLMGVAFYSAYLALDSNLRSKMESSSKFYNNEEFEDAHKSLTDARSMDWFGGYASQIEQQLDKVEEQRELKAEFQSEMQLGDSLVNQQDPWVLLEALQNYETAAEMAYLRSKEAREAANNTRNLMRNAFNTMREKGLAFKNVNDDDYARQAFSYALEIADELGSIIPQEEKVLIEKELNEILE